jgi:hypothetical protein
MKTIQAIVFVIVCIASSSTVLAQGMLPQGITPPCPKNLQFTVNSPSGGSVYVYDRVDCDPNNNCAETAASMYAFYGSQIVGGCNLLGGTPCKCNTNVTPIGVGGGAATDYSFNGNTTISFTSGTMVQLDYLEYDAGTPSNSADDQLFIAIVFKKNGVSESAIAARINFKPSSDMLAPIGMVSPPTFKACSRNGDNITYNGKSYYVFSY